jgi:NitT/TauT family transport system substrate-binding protein
MIQEGGGKVLVDERNLWPGGQFVTTQLLVRTAFLEAHPDVVEKLIEGHLAATDYINANPAEARDVVNAGVAKLTGKALSSTVVSAAWDNLSFTVDPIAASLRRGAANAQAVDLLDRSVKLDGIYDLTILNRVLGRQSRPPVNL